VVDKTLGNICLDTYPKTETDYSAKVDELREMLAKPEPPDRQFEPVPEGKSGNEKLCTYCSYCDFKKECYPELRTFIYSNGPVFLTKVEREPKVFEQN
jgi:RecB family exonuclease